MFNFTNIAHLRINLSAYGMRSRGDRRPPPQSMLHCGTNTLKTLLENEYTVSHVTACSEHGLAVSHADTLTTLDLVCSNAASSLKSSLSVSFTVYHHP